MDSRTLSGFPATDDSTPGLKPHLRVPGVYTIVREPLDFEVYLYEPEDDNGNRPSYLLGWNELEILLRCRLMLTDDLRERTMALLWNFNRINLDVDNCTVEVLRTKEEYEALFYDIIEENPNEATQ